MRERGRRIADAGREAFGRFGPIIRSGLGEALKDVTAGWENLKKLFTGFTEGLDLKIDLSGLTIDNAKIVAFQAMDSALAGIKTGWQALKDFGSGFAPYLEGIGKSLGGTINSVIRIGRAFARIGSALAQLVGIDQSKLGSIFKFLGDLAGGSIALAATLVEKLASGLAAVAEAIASVAEKIAQGINWGNLLPESVTGAWNRLAEAINTVKSALGGDPTVTPKTRAGKPYWPSGEAANQNMARPCRSKRFRSAVRSMSG